MSPRKTQWKEEEQDMETESARYRRLQPFADAAEKDLVSFMIRTSVYGLLFVGAIALFLTSR